MVRRAAQNDSEAIFRIESKAIECAWSEKDIKESILNENYVFYVAESYGEVVSYGGVRLLLDEAEICNIATDFNHRRKGYAKKILAEIERVCADRGVKEILLDVNINNKTAILFYEGFGYKQLYIRKNYYTSGDAIVMKKSL